MKNDRIPEDCVVFDTETTGFSAEEGDRLVEIGAVRMRGGLPTKETYHCHINPGRTVPQAAVDVHGLTTSFLADKPQFDEIAQDFVDFVGELPLVAHNATFDMKFINFQLAMIGLTPYPLGRFIDTIPIAKKKYPGQQVNLSALCRKMKINLDDREKHGALIDSELLAEVCVELMGGRQGSMFEAMINENRVQGADGIRAPLETFVLRATGTELEAHRKMIESLGANAIWHRHTGENA